MGRRWCDVTVETADGKRHTITVLARSVYWAANEFYSRSLSPKMGESLPALSDDTVFEVRALYRVEHKRLRAWANAIAAREMGNENKRRTGA
jgi:hypothetical protein